MYVNALGMALHPVVLSSLSTAGCNAMTKRAKLNVDQALNVRTMHAAGWTQKAIASHYGVRQQQVSRIIRGERWGKEVQRIEDARTHKKMLDLLKICSNIPSATER